MVFAIVVAIALNQGRDVTVVRELQEFEQRLATAWQKQDCSAWGAMLAPDWSVIHITGDVITKDKALEMCRAPRSGNETVAIEDVAVRVFGDAAVVTGRTTASAGPGSKVVLRFTDVFIRGGGQWRVVASHATELPGTRKADRSPPGRSVSDSAVRHLSAHCMSLP
jgi:ketosteroid isomerase-like protein